MAEILRTHPADRNFWPVDKVILFYFVLGFIPIVGWWTQIPDAWFYFTWHVVAIGLLLLLLPAAGGVGGFEGAAS